MNHTLWRRLCDYTPGPPSAELQFLDRLRRETGWSAAFASRAIAEYRRFVYLAVSAGHAVTPSDEVDQVWHLHLLYTREYWEHFCPKVLGCALHHGPTKGGVAENARFSNDYALTLKSYVTHFDQQPPADLWPSAQERFRRPQRYVRVDRERFWLVPIPKLKLRLMTAIAMASVMLFTPIAHALPANPLDLTADQFLPLQIGLIIASILGAMWWRRSLRASAIGASRQSNSESELAWLAYGDPGCMDACITRLLSDGHLELDGRLLRSRHWPDASAPEPDRSILLLARTGIAANELIQRTTRHLSAMREQLVRRGLALDSAASFRARWLPALLPAATLVFGCAKIIVGMQRDKPVGFLVLLSVVTAVAVLIFLLKVPRTTLEGDALIRLQRQKHRILKRAASSRDLPLAVALFGTAVLVSTPLAAYHAQRVPPGDGGGSGGGDGGGSSDSGGGGCGGCGGGGD
jgi:uncharacterized protein (TIGR04222 family)